MRSNENSTTRLLLHLWAQLHRQPSAKAVAADLPPLRAELFSADQMEQHGKALAESHSLLEGSAADRLLQRLKDNEVTLVRTCNLLTAAVKSNHRITPAGEWLLDNYYLIDDQIRMTRRHLPKNYSRELPRLREGPSAGLPRVYEMALEVVAHGDGRLDTESLGRFVAAYQTVSPLKLGELWAIPIMLRLALIENLRRVAVRIAGNRLERNQADYWADRMMDVAEHDPKSLILVVADMARSNQPLVSAFVAELARQLQGQSVALALPLTWIEQRLSESGSTIEQMVQAETQKQATAQVSISNCIGSLRFLGAMDWREFVETMSVVEQKLREDPNGTYGNMEFATRDRYRHAVEKIADLGKLSEFEVARKAIQLAHDGASAVDAGPQDQTPDARIAHVGYYLIDQGVPLLESAAQVKFTVGEAARKTYRRFPLAIYLGNVTLLTALFTGGLLLAAHAETLPEWAIAALAALVALCSSQVALAIVNWIASLAVTPYAIPRMDFGEGIPPEFRTLVAVPTMLGSEGDVDTLVESLEVRFLANRHSHLHFALLTDFHDAKAQTLPGDAALVQRAKDGIENLNRKYADEGAGSFFLLHRPRLWNPAEKSWMGYERKRGKLAELNALLRGKGKHRFAEIVGDLSLLRGVKFVITLDTDTQLPRDAAHELVGAMMHPLNRPHYNSRLKRVDEGYGVLQPRVAASLPGTNRSYYARLFSSEPGIDPYTRAVSDVYQDCFGEGSYVGKGIYDVDAFEQALDERLPENRILSHDLLEGAHARAGLLSDVQLYEDYPSRYSADVSRRHRWIRGDWQIASWILPFVPGYATDENHAGKPPRWQPNPLSALSRWKILDNLRRSLVPTGYTLLLLLAWTVHASPLLWTAAAIGLMLLPALLACILELLWRPEEVPLAQHLATVWRTTRQRCEQVAFDLVCLPHETWYSLDAIVRTNIRTLFSRKHLLQWVPSSEVERASRRTPAGEFFSVLRQMAISPLLSCAMTAYLLSFRASALPVAAPVLALWFTAPLIAWWVSRPLARRVPRLSSIQTAFLQKIARKTWAFFETMVGPEDHWLPPDNFQEHPVAVVAHRTSPTNIGMSLLANLAAYDFGYLTCAQLLQRTTNSFRTMESLERYQGHFYNWYDTLTLKPLNPLYVSSVDSGNLAGDLLTLRAGLSALADAKALSPRLFDGLTDTVRVLMDIATVSNPGTSRKLTQMLKELESAYDSRPSTFAATRQWLERIAEDAAVLKSLFAAGNTDVETTADTAAKLEADSPLAWWSQALVRQCRDLIEELTFLAPWSALPPAPPGIGPIPFNDRILSLRELANPDLAALAAIPGQLGRAATPEQREWLARLQEHIHEASKRARARIVELETLATQAGEFAKFEYGFLYDKTRHLLAIGYNVGDRRRDTSVYDLLASEARLATFVAIAQGQIPQESWFAMGRQLTTAAGAPALVSWSGSMFEYLMPLLIMPACENSLLDRTCHAAVERQIVYGFQRGVPWGMSESGFNAVDANLNYQYHAFGVPGLGLQRGLAEDLVVAPYASALALMVAPEPACLNLQTLSKEGLEGQFGFYEAVDYTPARLPRGQTSVIVRSFMAHHQGMVLLSLAHLNLDRPMQRRFESDPQFQATALLLHERVPKVINSYSQVIDAPDGRAVSGGAEMPIHLVASADTTMPEVQLLSNGRYHVMVTNAGGGYSRWKEIAVNRWGEDTTCDNWGSFCYIRDLISGEFWSNTHQPTLARADSYEALFSESRAEFRRRDFDYETHTEIVVSPEDDIELRRVKITNRSHVKRSIDVTSYAEVVLAPAVADALHPAFSNLFVQTEVVRDQRAIICTRRPRGEDEATPWMFHLMAVHGAEIGDISYETDRARFIGRGNTMARPAAMQEDGVLSGSQGSVLDPVVAIRYRITLDPEQSVTVDMVTGVGDTRDICLALVGKYQDRNLADRVFDLAWTHGWVSLRQINATEADAQLYSRLASCVIYAHASLRADPVVLAKNRRGQSGLWGYAISGDVPIVLLQIGDLANIDLVRQMVQAHAYWRQKGLAVDLVIWNEDYAGYRQALQDQIMGLIAAGVEAQYMDRPGGIFVRRAEQISPEDRDLMHSVARAIITDRRGTLAEQLKRRGSSETRAAYMNLPRIKRNRQQYGEPLPGARAPAIPARNLQFFNGYGGFAPDGREYVITTVPGKPTPLPWVNVLANPEFGSVVAENGIAYTWCENAHEFRLTPWTNDAVCDTGGEAIYVRDDDSGEFWSPAPEPRCGNAPYVCRHGFGYSVFEHSEDGIRSELWTYVALDAPVKFNALKLRNDSNRPRRISVTGYVEWVLGDLREKSAMYVVTEIDAKSGAMFARNAYNTEFPDRVAFFDVDETTRTVSGDRTEFIGRNGTLRNPAAMSRTRLSNKVGAGLDPCGALQVALDLAPGQERELVFTLGVTRTQRAEDAGKFAQKLRGPSAARAALDAVRQYWSRTLGTVQVETPDAALNVLANGWLPYQIMASRLWARSGFYQSSGAYGFRDQLQDVMALVYAEPALVREHLLRCAAHQFREGDVQHWWHPPSNRGVRTRITDDFLWLPLATCRYVAATGDTGVLEEMVQFIDGRPLNTDEESYYDLPAQSAESATLYQHCVRAIQNGLRFGSHGLPLMGTGDWNDGMNLVGAKGKGESIWLGFFQCTVLSRFAELARKHDDTQFAERCEHEADQLRRNLEQHGWDGAWYRRAYFDDGTPLGSAQNDECQIDSIAQSWAVLSGAGEDRHARQAMDALDQHLVRRSDAIIQLLDPPFDKSAMNPGYIKGYVPGVRENGGQYTHGAVWAAMAFAALGDSRRAWELFSMINPVNHGDSAEKIATYKVEPYVVAADVYATAPHTGRGGWTWYTGSAGWLYRFIVESLLGLQQEAGVLRLAPCLPEAWPSFTLNYRFRETLYRITVTRSAPGTQHQEAIQLSIDGVAQHEAAIPLVDDHVEHRVDVILPGAINVHFEAPSVMETL
jgi:cyclic beta-1,2-glucan synthetase